MEEPGQEEIELDAVVIIPWGSATGARDWRVDVCVANLFSLHT
jgi:hypothetical protein